MAAPGGALHTPWVQSTSAQLILKENKPDICDLEKHEHTGRITNECEADLECIYPHNNYNQQIRCAGIVSHKLEDKCVKHPAAAKCI